MIAAAAGPLPAAAQSACKAPSQDCVVVGDLGVSLSFGAGTRTNPVDGRDDIPLYVIPQISYYGKRFFLESLEPGVTLYESDAHTFNLIATPGYDRVFFSRNDLQNVIVVDLYGQRRAATAAARASSRSRSAAATPRTWPARNGCSGTAISSARSTRCTK